MLDIRKSHSYVRALFHAMLAEHDDWAYIVSAINKHYANIEFGGMIEKLYQLEDEVDRAYILKIPGECIIVTSGTKSLQGWLRNAQCILDNGWHYGFRKSFRTILMNPIIEALRGFNGKISLYGHSAGSAISINAAYFIRSSLQRNCESITYCGPQTMSKLGKSQCSKAHVCSTTLNIGIHDQVDNIGNLLGGVDYGKIVKLPDVGDPKIHSDPLIDRFFFGHAPSYVCKSLKVLMQRYNKPQDEFIDEISQYAIK